MIFIYIFTVSVLSSLIFKRSIWNPLNTNFKWFYLIFIPFALELFVVLKNPGDISGYLTSVAYIMLAIFCLVNWHVKGFPLVTAGVLSNSLVVLVNGGKMPVSSLTLVLAGLPSNMIDAKHVFMGGKTLLPFLADVIPINFLNLHYACSVGDLMVYTGLFLIFYLNAPNKLKEKKDRCS